MKPLLRSGFIMMGLLGLAGLLSLNNTLEPTTGYAQGGTPVAANFDPPQIDGAVCQVECITQQVLVSLPPLEQSVGTPIDIMFVMDVTGSMDDELSSVKTNALQIVNNLRATSPDLRFGFAIYADYPDLGGDPIDTPYQLVSPLTTDFNAFNDQLVRVGLRSGGDTAESTLRALWESSMLDWRDGALHIIVLFTDADAHDPDAGRDEQHGTDDDLTTTLVVDALNDANITVIGVQSDNNPDARAFLQNITSETEGEYFSLSNASQIPNSVVELVGIVVERNRLRFVPSQFSFNVAEGASDGWFTQSPDGFEYPQDGQPVTVDVQICPSVIDLPSGDYNLDLVLRAGDNTYGTVNVAFSYNALCSDVYVRDNPADTGATCSDIGGEPFWESPDIVVRQQADNGTVSQFPLVGQANTVYVSVYNSGPRPAENAQVILYASEQQFIGTFPDGWQEVGRQTVNLAAEANERLSYTWTPQVPHVSLRAVVQSTDDPVRTENDTACDNNIAQLNRIPVTLNQPSYGAGLLGGELYFNLSETLIYNALDLEMDVASLNTPNGFVYIDLEHADFINWADRSGQISGGDIRGERIAGNPGSNLRVVNIVGGPDVAIDGRMLIAAAENGSGAMPIALNAQDRTVIGSTIYFTTDTTGLPQKKLPTMQAAPTEPPSPLTLAIPIGLLVVLGILCGMVYVLKKRH